MQQNNALYCGITTDLERRMEQHRAGKGAKWFRGKTIVEMVWSEKSDDKSTALKREIQIKALSKKQKEHLIMANRK